MPAAVGNALVIGLDLDGVCADYTGAMRRVVADHAGVDVATLPPKSLWGFEEWGLNQATFRQVHRDAVDNRRIFKDLAPIPGAVEAVTRLHDRGDSIRVITNRLCDFVDPHTVIADTIEWLQAFGLPFDEICFVVDKSTIAADVYIDDSPHVLERLTAAGRAAIVFDQLYNRHAPGVRVRDWGEALHAVDAVRVRRAA